MAARVAIAHLAPAATPSALDAWYSASDLAELGLPGVPRTKRKVTLLAKEAGWGREPGKVRQVKGLGGTSFEYHASLLPMSAQKELMRRAALAPQNVEPATVTALHSPTNAAIWAAFEALPAKRKEEAAKRLAVIQAVEALVLLGTNKTRAIQIVGDEHSASPATINAWFALVRGVAPCDRLAHLAPQTKGGGRKAEIDPELWDFYRSDWLRPNVTYAAAYWRTERLAKARGIAIPHAKTFQKRLEAETPRHVIIACREGRERVAQMLPAQRRTVARLHALHTVNIDGHRWDVRVLWPDGTIERPLMVGIQDVFSRKLLAWRVDKSETAVLTRLAFADLFKNYGIPIGCVLDNGKAFASKWITGGTDTRYRFKIKPDDPLGLLPSLGIAVHWATPYHGQAKPIERYWRMMCNLIATGPDFHGAYTGNSTSTKPHNYGERAIPLADFERIIAREIAAINARQGRRTEMAKGGSFDDAFAASIAAGAPVGRATEAQMRLALLAAERIYADKTTGAIAFAGNRYWSEAAIAHAGKRLTVRFDPDNLHSSVFAYDADDRLVGELAILEDTGFLDHGAAKAHAKRMADHRRKTRELVAEAGLIGVEQLARSLADLGAPDAPEVPAQPQVIRPVRGRSNAAAALQVEPTTDPTNFNDRFRDATARLRLVE
jgi:transposase InsO family protein